FPKRARNGIGEAEILKRCQTTGLSMCRGSPVGQWPDGAESGRPRVWGINVIEMKEQARNRHGGAGSRTRSSQGSDDGAGTTAAIWNNRRTVSRKIALARAVVGAA